MKTLNYSLFFLIKILYNYLGDYMKKKYLYLLLIILLTGCHKETIIENTIPKEKNEEINIIEEEKYIDDNPIKVGLYQNNNLIDSYSTTLSNTKDITSFDVYLTNDEEIISGRQVDKWNYYYDKYQNIDKYKVGFNIKFQTKDKEINENILNPSNMYNTSPYMYIYLYDDIIHSNDSWYSHIEESEYNDQTIISSIKLYLAEEGENITSSIYLTVFTYDEDDFDELNNYRGNSKYTLEIKTN